MQNIKEKFIKEKCTKNIAGEPIVACSSADWIYDFFEPYLSSQLQPQVKPEIAEETENILLSELIRHLRTDFEDGEVISYRIKVKQPFSTREIRYPSK